MNKKLAIFVLILLTAVLAWQVPKYLADKRDEQRMTDLRYVKEQLKKYSENNQAKVPATVIDFNLMFKSSYLKEERKDPSTGKAYEYAHEPGKGVIGYRGNATCGADNAGFDYYALKTVLENGQTGCVDNKDQVRPQL